MSTHRFILQPYRGVGSRHTCPACHKKRCFSRYIDTEKQISFPDDVGRCDHEQSCGYHLTPKEYFERNPQYKPQHSDWSAPSARRATLTEPPKPTSFIAVETVSQTLHGYDRNNLFLFLKSKFGPDDAERMMSEYCVGTSKHLPGACVFWQTDINGRVRTGKVMLYDAESGKRVKEPFNHVSWAHSLMKLPDFSCQREQNGACSSYAERSRDWRETQYNLRQCFFGEHLLPMNRGKPVALVESEKTALIASWYLPEYVWLATGGKNGCLNADALRVLRGRQVILYPDLGATERWRQKLPLMKSLGIEATIFNFMDDVADDTDKSAGYDIADYLLQIEPDQAVLQTMIRKYPMLQKFIDDLQLELVSVERYDPTTETPLSNRINEKI